MSEAKQPFNENDPFDAIADDARKHVGDAALATVTTPLYQTTDPHTSANALCSGLMVGVLGGLQSITSPEGHAELRAALIENFDFYFDTAREINGLPPMPPRS